MTIGKIKNLNFRSLFILITFALVIISYSSKNYIYLILYISSFILTAFLSKQALNFFKKYRLFQNIREEGPSNHFKKANTPTMGGVVIIIPFLILLLILAIKSYSIKISLLLFCTFGFFTIGFLDDYLSIKNKKNTGLKSIEKIILQSLISVVFIFLAYKEGFINPSIAISNNLEINTSFFIIPISFLTLIGLSNSVNLTDGLDGLASGCCGVAFYGLGTEILLRGQQELIIFSVLCYSMSGMCLGFLKFNKHPARIFMGDTGSLSFGAILASIGILTNSFFTLFIFSGVFIIESLSVLTQVTYFKITKILFKKGKRVFLMSPLHHHYELKGMKEEKIVENFWKINILLVIFGIVLRANT